MATFILRPTSDKISTNFTKSSGTTAYNLVNETTQDGSTTYIYSNAKTASLRLYCDYSLAPNNIDLTNVGVINSITAYAYACIGSAKTTTINIGVGSDDGKIADSYLARAVVNPSSYSAVSNSATIGIKASNIDLHGLYIIGDQNGVAKGELRITQMYLVVDYSEPVITQSSLLMPKVDGSYVTPTAEYVKVDGVWKPVEKVYTKIDGVWI